MRKRPVTACLVLGAGLLWAGSAARSDEPVVTIVPNPGPVIVAPEAGASPKVIPVPASPAPPEILAQQPVSPPATGKTADEAPPRYRFSPSGDGFVRLDSQTGEVSYCAPRTAGWACQPAADERAALEAEIARLADANVALKHELGMQQALPPPPSPEPDAAPPETPKTVPKAAPDPLPKGYRVPEGGMRLPSNEDIDRAMAYASKVWKRLFDMLNDIQKDAREKI
ncbi:MAG: hypothetical protein ACTHLY_09750 [Pseudolabrys sp.]